jgi:protein O-mannosyl-transferase
MPVKPAKMTPVMAPDWWQAALPALALALLVIVFYLPALHGQFIWDDDFHVLKNASLRSLHGLWRIWTEPGASQQYYPLTWSSFWIDYQLWGLRPMAYHVENILLHALNAILVWRILRRLNVKGAWLAAALFAVHPVCVESVAWVSERKNTLSGLFFLLSLRAAIEFWLPTSTTSQGNTTEPQAGADTAFGRRKFYWLALGLYVCALWSKSVTAVLPGVILLLVWWKRGSWRRKDALLVLPFLAVGLAMVSITASIEHHFVIDPAANIDEWKLSWGQKFIIAGRALWFYLGKLCWPHPLVFVYPRWVIRPSQPLAYLPLAAAVVVFVLLWRKRHTWGRPVLTAAAYFVLVLLPALGFINIFPFRYSFVADHFQYLAALGPLALAAAGITSLLARVKNDVLRPSIIGALLAVLGVLTWRQTGIYQNLEVLWRDTLAHNPTAWMAEDNLGRCLTESGDFTEAELHYRKAIEIRPNDHIAYYDLGLESAIRGKLDDAIENFNKTLELNPNFAMAHYQIANVQARRGALDDAIREYNAALKAIPSLAIGHFNLANALLRNGNADAAVEEYHRTLENDPDYAPAHTAIGRILGSKGDTDGAISQYREALKIDANSVEALANLGNALVSQGQLDQAITCYRAALQLDPNSSVIHFNLSVALSRQGNASEAQAERDEANRLRAARPPL